MDGYTIKALDDSTWEHFAAMVERNSGLFSGCWCTWFHPQDREPDEANPANKCDTCTRKPPSPTTARRARTTV